MRKAFEDQHGEHRRHEGHPPRDDPGQGAVPRSRVPVAAESEPRLQRAADALHLACAAEAGLGDVYSSDRHLVAAAPHFGLRAVTL